MGLCSPVSMEMLRVGVASRFPQRKFSFCWRGVEHVGCVCGPCASVCVGVYCPLSDDRAQHWLSGGLALAVTGLAV